MESSRNQCLLAELVINNGDDFSKALLKTTVLDDFCNLVWKYGSKSAKVLTCGDDAVSFIGKYKDASDVINCFKTGNVSGISNLTNSKVSNVYTFATDKLGRTFVAGSGNYDKNPTIIVPEGYFDDMVEYTGTNYNIYYFEKYNNLLTKDYIKEMTISESIKNELYKLSDAVSYTKTEAKSFNKYYQYGSIREQSFTSSHSVTNCGEIWSAYNVEQNLKICRFSQYIVKAVHI